MRRVSRVLAVAAVVVLGSCGAGSGDRQAEPTAAPATDPAPEDRSARRDVVEAAVGGTVWTLVSMTVDGVAYDPVPGNPVTMTTGGRGLVGTSGCNQYGLVPPEGSVLPGLTYMVESTAMLCEDDRVMQVEGVFTEAMTRADTAEQADGTLTVTGPGSTLRFVPGT